MGDLKPGDRVLVEATLVSEDHHAGFERTFCLVDANMRNLTVRVPGPMVKPDPTPILEGLLRYCRVFEGQTLDDIDKGEEIVAKAKTWLEGR